MTNQETLRSFMYKEVRALEIFAKEVSLINGPYITTPELDVKILLAHLLKCDHFQLRAYYDDVLSKKIKDQFLSYIKRRKNGEPVSKIIGKKEFWRETFKVTKDTLDPRPDSETLIEAILNIILDQDKYFTILDLGTGTGCLLLTLISELQNAKGVGVDISQKALKIAQENAENLGVSSRSEFIQSNWFENVSSKFDIIVSNPPYIVEKDIFSLSNEVKKYDPMLALNGGKEGLDAYHQIISKLKNYINDCGIYCFEIGFNQSAQVSQILRENDFNDFKVIKDYSNQNRCIIGKI